jgi:hypothetical protein
MISAIAGALVGDRLHVDFHRAQEQQAAQVGGGTQPGVAVGHLLAVGPEIIHELLERIGRQVLPRDQRHRHVGYLPDVLVVGEGIDRRFAVQRRGGGHPDVGEEHGVAVGLGLCHLGIRDGAAGAGNVLDDHLLLERAAHHLTQDATERIGRPARGKRDGEDNGPVRVVLGAGDPWRDETGCGECVYSELLHDISSSGKCANDRLLAGRQQRHYAPFSGVPGCREY